MWPDQWAVVAESDRDRWDFEPLERVGPLRFGMSLEEAVAAMGAGGFVSETSAIHNFGPFEQVRAKFRKATATGFLWGREVEATAAFWRTDVAAYFVDSIGLTCVVVDALTGPQVTVEGIRLIGRRPSELADEITAHQEKHGGDISFTPEADISHPDWGMLPRAQRAGDVLLTRGVFGRPNSWANTMFDCIPADEWVGHRAIGSVGWHSS
ncbi:hypothetical protein [Kitasatospora sp. KL5]|uniref:hypothetical protein n=1 Tax=Kitasatospora sp. KL5 TaxID=3425125 RepID=UPI003D6DAFB5